MTTDSIITAMKTGLTMIIAAIPISFFDNVVNSLEAISAIIVAGTAIWGLTTWREKKRWVKRYEIAEKVLTKAYALQQAITDIRQLSLYDHNEPERIDYKAKAKKEYMKVRRRINEHVGLLSEMNSLIPRFKAIIDPEQEGSLQEFGKLFADIDNAALYRYRSDSNRGQDGSFNPNLFNKEKYGASNSIISNFNNNESDEFSKKVAAAVENVRKVCDPLIQTAVRNSLK